MNVSVVTRLTTKIVSEFVTLFARATILYINRLVQAVLVSTIACGLCLLSAVLWKFYTKYQILRVMRVRKN